MSRELRILVWCDLCPEDDETEAVASHIVTVDGLTREIDLCGQHDGIVTTLGDTLRTHGHKPDADPKPRPAPKPVAKLADHEPGPRQRPRVSIENTLDVPADFDKEAREYRICPICPDEYVLSTRNGLASHVRERHGTTLTELGLSFPRGWSKRARSIRAAAAAEQPALTG